MNFEDQLRRYFGTSDIASIPADGLAAGAEHMLVNFGLETDRPRRFAMWTLMHILGIAPDLDIAFKDADDREAARNFMDLAARSEDEHFA